MGAMNPTSVLTLSGLLDGFNSSFKTETNLSLISTNFKMDYDFAKLESTDYFAPYELFN